MPDGRGTSAAAVGQGDAAAWPRSHHQRPLPEQQPRSQLLDASCSSSGASTPPCFDSRPQNGRWAVLQLGPPCMGWQQLPLTLEPHASLKLTSLTSSMRPCSRAGVSRSSTTPSTPTSTPPSPFAAATATPSTTLCAWATTARASRPTAGWHSTSTSQPCLCPRPPLATCAQALMWASWSSTLVSNAPQHTPCQPDRANPQLPTRAAACSMLGSTAHGTFDRRHIAHFSSDDTSTSSIK